MAGYISLCSPQLNWLEEMVDLQLNDDIESIHNYYRLYLLIF